MEINPFEIIESQTKPYAFTDEYFYELKELILILKNGVVDKYLLFEKMIKFEILYNSIRPYKIDRNDPYFGTVRILDGIYEILYAYIGIERTNYFSKFNNNSTIYPENKKEIDMNNILWENVIDDLDFVIRAMKIKLGLFSLSEFIRKGNVGFQMQNYLVGLIDYYNKSKTKNYVEFNGENNSTLIINGKNVKVQCVNDVIINDS